MFKYYIFDPFIGAPIGTNSTAKAQEYAICEDYFVVDVEKSVWIMADLSEESVKDADD